MIEELILIIESLITVMLVFGICICLLLFWLVYGIGKTEIAVKENLARLHNDLAKKDLVKRIYDTVMVIHSGMAPPVVMLKPPVENMPPKKKALKKKAAPKKKGPKKKKTVVKKATKKKARAPT